MARRTKLTKLAILPALALALSAAACGEDTGGGSGNGDDAVELVQDGQLTTCTSLPYPPFQDKKGDKVVGFDVELVDLLAKELGVEQQIKDVDFAQIKNGAALNARQCDIAAAGMTITEERKQNLDFGLPYFDEELSVVVPTGSGVKSLDEVQSKNLKLGVQADTTSLDYANSKKLDPTVFRNAGLQAQAMQTPDKVDIILQDSPTVQEFLKKDGIKGKWEVVDKVVTGDQYGYAVKKGNKELLDKLNEVLQKAYDDGTWAELYEKWIGDKPAKTPEAG